jgi:hypothetical protein
LAFRQAESNPLQLLQQASHFTKELFPMPTLLIRNGRVIDPANQHIAGITRGQ